MLRQIRPFVAALVGGLVLFGLAPGHAATRIERVKTPSGIEAWLVQEKRIPMISLEVVWRGGSTRDPAGREGAAAMVAALLDEGAGDMDSQTFQARLEDRAISLSFGAERDRFRGNLRTLTQHRAEAFRLLGLALSQPRLDSEPIDRVRRQILVKLERSASDPDTIASRAWNANAFPDHPYGRPSDGSAESVSAIARSDLKAFIADRLALDNMVIGVVGDVTPDELAQLLESTFGSLPPKAKPIAIPHRPPLSRAEPLVVERDIPQSVVVFGGPGIKRDHPDYYAAHILNYVLGGGGFVSRLTEQVREKRGLAYSVHSYLAPMDHAALYMGGVGTRNESVAESLALIKAEMKRMRESGITAEELANAKSYLTGSFPLRLSSNARIAGLLVSIQLENLGLDYIERYASYIERVTLDDANRVARDLFDPNDLLIVVVGRPVGLGG